MYAHAYFFYSRTHLLLTYVSTCEYLKITVSGIENAENRYFYSLTHLFFFFLNKKKKRECE